MILQDWLDKKLSKEEQLNLTSLHCYGEKLTSLKGIELLINLTFLNFSYNELTSLEGIENLHNLKALSCNNNSLTSLKGVENLINLEELYCSYNFLTSLKGIENLNLKYLYCVDNPLPYKSKDLKGIIKEVKSEVRKEKIKKLLL